MLASEQFLGIRPDRPQRVQPIRHLRPGIRQRLERTDHGHAGHVWCHVFIVILVASKPHSHSHHPPISFRSTSLSRKVSSTRSSFPSSSFRYAFATVPGVICSITRITSCPSLPIL